MIKKIVDEMYVKVFVEDPAGWGKEGEERVKIMQKDLKNLENQIKRHVDCFDIDTDYDSHWECSFCGSLVAAEDDYECCDKSIEEHEAENEPS